MKVKGKNVSPLKATLVNGLAWLQAGFVTFIYSSIGLLIILPISFLFDSRRRMMHIVARLWAKSLLAGNPLWTVECEGLNSIDRKKHYVVVANHQSIVDILVVLAALPLQFKFIAKKELFSLPWLGWHMWGAGYIALDRQSKQSGKSTIETAKRWLDRGISVLFFPEGTRSEDAEIKAFKNGAFKIAVEKKITVLPVVLDGTGASSPKKSKTINKTASLKVHVCKPVPVAAEDTVESLRDHVREVMCARLAQMRNS